MFNRRRLEQRARELEAQIEQAKAQIAGLECIVENRAALVAIQREGRTNKFVFMRNRRMIVVETFGTISDDITGWTAELLE